MRTKQLSKSESVFTGESPENNGEDHCADSEFVGSNLQPVTGETADICVSGCCAPSSSAGAKSACEGHGLGPWEKLLRGLHGVNPTEALVMTAAQKLPQELRQDIGHTGHIVP